MSLKFHRWLHRNGLSRQRLRKGRLVHWLGDWIHAREYWVPTRESLARGWLIGTLSACSPFMGLQIIMALPFALFFHANIPIILFLILLTNPLTAPFYYAGAYWLGSVILGMQSPETPLPTEGMTPAELQALDAASSWEYTDGMLALVVGCAVVGVTLALSGYFLIHLFWKPKKKSRPLAPLSVESRERSSVGDGKP